MRLPRVWPGFCGVLAAAALSLGVVQRVAAESAAAREDWPQFLGPNRDGSSEDAALVEGWRRGRLAVVWRGPVGVGYSGLAVRNDRVYGMDSDGASEFVFALRASDGAPLWRVRTGVSPSDVYGGDGPRVTPSVAGQALFTVSGEGAALALDAATGRILWRRPLGAELGWRRPAEGTACSPLVADGRVYLVNGGSEGRAVAALEAASGRTLWASQDDRTSYASPVRWDVAGVSQALFLTGSTLFSVQPDSGRLLWRYPWPTYDFVNAASPLVIPPDRVFISSGYDQGAALLQVSKTASGALEARELWRNREMKNHFNNSVHQDGVLYGFDNAILKALDAANGQTVWRERGFGKGSLIRVADRLVLLSEDGALALARASRDGLAVEARQPVLSGRCWTPPSVARGRIYLRSLSEIVALAPAGASLP